MIYDQPRDLSDDYEDHNWAIPMIVPQEHLFPWGAFKLSFLYVQSVKDGIYTHRGIRELNNFEVVDMSIPSDTNKWLPELSRQDSLVRIKDWLHEETPLPSMGLTSTLPTRLIHFLPANASEESEMVRLETNNMNATTEYAALSHCWGGKHPLMLRHESLKELVGGVPLTTLPRTFQDAIKLAASLGIHHLWIDSLCIIQDSKEDWEAEAARMASVYLGAKVTISATAADDSSTGTMPDSMLRYPTYIKPTWTGFADIPRLQKPFRIIDNTSFSRRVLLRTIFTRGWVYQERILSPKVIHCADDQLWWFSISDAKGYVFNETCKGHEFDVLRMSSLSQSVSPSELYSVRPNSEASPSRRVWWSLVEDYMTRQFTFDSDRLIAIGGVTSVYQRLSGLREDAYLAGLWRHTLLEDLLWTTREGRRSSPPQGYRAPSWSWASMEPIHYHTHKFSLGSVNVQSSSDGLRTFGLVASVEDAKVETTSSRFGSVVDGHLVLHGPLIRAKLSSQMIDVPGAYMYASGISEFFPGGILKYQLSTLSLPEREDAKEKEIADVIADVDLVTKPTLDDTFPIYCSMGESVVYLAVIEHHQFTQDSKLKADRAHALVLERGLYDGEYRRIGYVFMAPTVLYPLSLHGTFGAFDPLNQDEYLRVGEKPGYYVYRVV
ncbi:tol protein [Colletotrichum asianum]